MKKCIFPGSFNPFTLGHYEIVKMALKKYDHVIVAVADITYKDDMLEGELRAEIARLSLENTSNVAVERFSGMLTDYISQKQIYTIIRGIRSADDALYEEMLINEYKKVHKDLLFEHFSSNLPHISSSTVRTIASRGDCLDELICKNAIKKVRQLYAK